MAAQYVFLVDLADYLKRTPSALHERSRRIGIKPVSIRRERSGKAAMAVTTDEAKRLMALDVQGAATIRPEDLAKEMGI
jgi:hypothetical protein